MNISKGIHGSAILVEEALRLLPSLFSEQEVIKSEVLFAKASSQSPLKLLADIKLYLEQQRDSLRSNKGIEDLNNRERELLLATLVAYLSLTVFSYFTPEREAYFRDVNICLVNCETTILNISNADMSKEELRGWVAQRVLNTKKKRSKLFANSKRLISPTENQGKGEVVHKKDSLISEEAIKELKRATLTEQVVGDQYANLLNVQLTVRATDADRHIGWAAIVHSREHGLEGTRVPMKIGDNFPVHDIHHEDRVEADITVVKKLTDEGTYELSHIIFDDFHNKVN